MNVDTLPRTLLVASGVALFCSAMVSLAVDLLRPMQFRMQSVERYRAILQTGDLLPAEGVADRDVVTMFLDLDARVIDLDTGSFTRTLDPHAYDHWQLRAQIQTEDDGTGQGERFVPVYLVRKANRVQQVILPVDGPGMWSTIYGYVGLGEDFNTITGAAFHRHGETPGVGDRIQDPAWLASWRGKQIRDEEGTLRFRVTRNASGPYEVDIVSGASVTTQAAGEIARTWLGEQYFGPFLKNLDNTRQ